MMAKSEDRSATGSVHGNVLVIKIQVEQVRDPETSYALRDEILRLVDSAKPSHIAMDFCRVAFMGSVGLLSLLAVRRRLQGGRIVICNCSESIRRMFEVCQLLSRDPSAAAPFEAADSREEALARLSG
ncbi:MAG: STAS domain-containing protein [Pirellulales bacterium]|nr:STAS domain-containing protein [Pirellulales bacterium]